MNESAIEGNLESCYELRFARLCNPGRGYTFPCDAQGHVDLDALGGASRLNYFYARTVIGREFFAPVTCVVHHD